MYHVYLASVLILASEALPTAAGARRCKGSREGSEDACLHQALLNVVVVVHSVYVVCTHVYMCIHMYTYMHTSTYTHLSLSHNTYYQNACHISEADAVANHLRSPRGRSHAMRPFAEAAREDVQSVRLVSVYVRVFYVTPMIIKHVILPSHTYFRGAPYLSEDTPSQKIQRKAWR